MSDTKTEEARVVLREVPAVVGGACFADAEEPELKAVLAEVRAAQRCLDGVVIDIGIRSNQLAALGKAAPAEETVRGAGMVGAHQARKEAARATTVEHVPALGDAISTGQISGEHIDAIARHAPKLTEEQRARFDFVSLVDAAAGLAPETFDRQVKRRIEHVVGDHGLTDTTTRQAASEFRQPSPPATEPQKPATSPRKRWSSWSPPPPAVTPGTGCQPFLSWSTTQH